MNIKSSQVYQRDVNGRRLAR